MFVFNQFAQFFSSNKRILFPSIFYFIEDEKFKANHHYINVVIVACSFFIPKKTEIHSMLTIFNKGINNILKYFAASFKNKVQKELHKNANCA